MNHKNGDNPRRQQPEDRELTFEEILERVKNLEVGETMTFTFGTKEEAHKARVKLRKGLRK